VAFMITVYAALCSIILSCASLLLALFFFGLISLLPALSDSPCKIEGLITAAVYKGYGSNKGHRLFSCQSEILNCCCLKC